MTIQTMEILGFALLAAGVVLAVVALILLKVFDIPAVLKQLKGSASAKVVEEMRKTHGRAKSVDAKQVKALENGAPAAAAALPEPAEQEVKPAEQVAAAVAPVVVAAAQAAEEGGTQLLDAGTQLLQPDFDPRNILLPSDLVEGDLEEFSSATTMLLSDEVGE